VSSRGALPGLAAGLLGLVAGIIGLILETPSFGVVAGVLAAAIAIAGVRNARQLDDQTEVQRLVEEELRSVRKAASETEAELRDEIKAGQSKYEARSEEEDDYDEDGHDPLTDEITGLFSESFFGVALDSRVAAARRHLRPVSVVLLEVVEGLPSDEPQITDASTVAKAIKATLREADTACRLRNGDFALLLEDTPENGAIWTVERIRRFISESGTELTLWAGVACYPAHAFSPGELMEAAGAALESAREWRQDRIEVAMVASD
jgi:two-component system cell cycle response regulator